MWRCARTRAAILAVFVIGCGARSGLGSDDDEAATSAGGSGNVGGASSSSFGGGGVGASSSTTDASSSSNTATSSTGAPCTTDLECDDDVDCTIDTCGDFGCENAPNAAACADSVLCTLDVCSPVTGCSNTVSNAPCDDGFACTLDVCDTFTDSCDNDPCDSLCDDGTFCNGVERCDTSFGCTSGPAACTLSLGCEFSACAEGGQTCTHVLPLGCVAPDVHLLVTDAQGNLYDVTPYDTPTQTLIAPTTGQTHLDIAVLGDRWFAIQGSVVELEPGTNQVIDNLGGVPGNALGAGPDGMLYAVSTIVTRVNPNNAATLVMGSLPPGHSSSGDVAFLGSRMFVSTDSGCGGSLVEFDLDTGVGTVLGGDGLGCVYGLAAVGADLYIVNCDGKVGTFDPDTGEARIFATTSVTAYGADALP
jgi:hypothetical protein